jgi:hypothetical protein
VEVFESIVVMGNEKDGTPIAFGVTAVDVARDGPRDAALDWAREAGTGAPGCFAEMWRRKFCSVVNAL